MVKDECMGEWMDVLASKEPVPGGGGATAVAGAMAAALGQMVANLTIGKKKYADVEEHMIKAAGRLKELQKEMLALADQDGEVFMALSAAYKLPSDTDEEKAGKEEKLEADLAAAAEVPLKVIEKTGEIIDLLDQIGSCGSKNALSDAGVAAQFAKTAILGSVMTITINTNSMKDRGKADEIDKKAQKLSEEYSSQADAVYERVIRKLSDIRE